jgi:hypothetical protein
MASVNSPASPLSKFILSTALRVVVLGWLLGRSNAEAAMAVDEEAVVLVLLVLVLEAPLKTFEMSETSSVLWLVVTVTAASSSALSLLLVAVEDAAFVFTMSTSCNNIQLAGYQPRSQMVVLLVSFLPKDFVQTQLTKGIASLLSMTFSVPILVLKRTSLPFYRFISTLYCPFC